MMAETAAKVVVGYALRPKRVTSFMSPDLLSYAKDNNVEFVPIDPIVPLVEQGPFDMVLHKLEGDSWANNLSDYSKAHPECVVVDAYDAVHKLDDRREMLAAVAHLDANNLGGSVVEVPKQIILELGTKPEDIADVLQKAGFSLPAVAKPLEANGTTSSHTLGLILEEESLLKLQPPVLLQEFVNHGGILFKLYVLGDKVMVFRRQSLPDIPPPSEWPTENATASEKPPKWDFLKKGMGIVEFNRISNEHLPESELMDNRVTDPPPEVMREIGLGLRKNMQLQTFNVDILREGGHGNRYFIVDINYMPGYERIPGFPELFVNFVKQCVAAHRETQGLPSAVAVAAGSDSVQGLPAQPYQVLPAKKKWAVLSAAMKFCGARGKPVA
eukprot:TRINITY_DN26972_c0_g1_i2.p1 TRINITY_DN26972_c0_g1~~TRINITY_DN26972_c0_g1_i2.p1  ORF type:complete len:385 (+),score=35.10 TRINITY_DN26972_c0_g1_i2:190-1344(+)